MTEVSLMIDRLEAQPVIAAVRDVPGLEAALKSPAAAVFLVNATLKNLRERVGRLKEHGKSAFVHLEMVAGLSKDAAALEFLKEEIHPTGIITTKPNLIPAARHLGLITIQRLFVLDSLSVQTGLKMMQGNQPDFIEIMPGVIPKVIPEIRRHTRIPVIAGGMISTKEEIIEQLRVGVIAVSTGKEELWGL